MKIFYLLIAQLFYFLTPMYLFSQDIDYKGFPEWSLNKRDSTEYALYTPANLKPGEKYPIALFLHGCCGTDNHASLRNAVDPPVRMWHQFGANKQQIPTYIISPATSRGWKQHFGDIKAVIDELVQNHQGDPTRIYVCGFSMGANGTYQILQKYPDLFAAAFTMGSDYSGDSVKLKDIPLWMNQGETDWFSRKMRKQVAALRVLNGDKLDTGSTWTTGVNPLYTNFKDMGHVIQWPAVSMQDATEWAYSKINDGNKYPTIFFSLKEFPMQAISGKPFKVEITAMDVDGKVDKVLVYINGILYKELLVAPYQITFNPKKGDNFVEAVAIDNMGKQTSAKTRIKVNIATKLTTKSIPDATAGFYYNTKLQAKGNGVLNFSLKPNFKLPPGINLYTDGTIKGITSLKGIYEIEVVVKDEDNDSSSAVYQLSVHQKKSTSVLVTNIVAASGSQYRLSSIKLGEAPCFNSKDILLSDNLEEINFSKIDGYEGLTFIQPDINDADTVLTDFLTFNTDENVIVYVAYEKFNRSKKSTIPGWLNSFTKQTGEIVAQYRYFDIYMKKYSRGKIVLPGAEAKQNGVTQNYFVMVKKDKE